MNRIYYGSQTQKALENFPYTLPTVSLDMIYAVTEIKKAAAIVNGNEKLLPKTISTAIV